MKNTQVYVDQVVSMFNICITIKKAGFFLGGGGWEMVGK